MARNLHILFGFEECSVSKQVITHLKTKGYFVDAVYQSTKASISDYINRHPDCNTLILLESMGDEIYTATELAALNDQRLHNIIVVLDESHKGTSYMQVLYSAGITSALFGTSTTGVSDIDLLQLILHPRNNKRAREYYGMTNMKAQVNILTSDSYVSNYTYLIDETKGVNIIDRYVCIVNRLPVDQAVDFTRRLPSPVLKKLMQYEEFYRVMALFSRRGYKLKYKKQRNLKRGMSDEAFNAYLNGKSLNQLKRTTSSQQTAPVRKVVKKQAVAKPVKRQASKPAPKPVLQKKSARSENAFFDEKEKHHTKQRAKQKINWNLIIGILIAGCLMLVIFFFVLKYMML